MSRFYFSVTADNKSPELYMNFAEKIGRQIVEFWGDTKPVITEIETGTNLDGILYFYIRLELEE